MKHFLLVDDDAVMNLVHREMITKFIPGSEVHMCESCTDALRYLKDQMDQGRWPEFVLLDINMPEMDGFEVVSQLRNFPQEVLDQGKVLILSSSLHPADRQRAERDDLIDEMLTKPLTKVTLQRLVEG